MTLARGRMHSRPRMKHAVYLVAGLLVWVPLGVTLLLLKLLAGHSLRSCDLPPAYRPENLLGFSIPYLASS